MKISRKDYKELLRYYNNGCAINPTFESNELNQVCSGYTISSISASWFHGRMTITFYKPPDLTIEFNDAVEIGEENNGQLELPLDRKE